jgi:hypothetical protein
MEIRVVDVAGSICLSLSQGGGRGECGQLGESHDGGGERRERVCAVAVRHILFAGGGGGGVEGQGDGDARAADEA